MTIRFQADADFNQNILLAVVRREPTVDFKTSLAAGLPGLTDHNVLAKAAEAGRVLVTHDHRTMPNHFAQFIQRNTSAGLIIVRQSLPVRTVVDDLLLIHEATDADEWINRIAYLPL